MSRQKKERSKKFIFTQYNLEFPWEEFINDPANGCKYICYGNEVCPTTGRPHQQGYIFFNNNKEMPSVSKTLGCFTKCMHGSIEKNDDYCSKQKMGGLIEFGEKPKDEQGKRSDLEAIMNDILENHLTELEIAMKYPVAWLQYGNRFNRLRQLTVPKRDYKCNVTWCWGPAETGKSRYAFDHGYDNVKFTGTFWLLNEEGMCPEDVIFEDLVPGDDLPFSEWLKVTDRYAVMLNIKNGLVKCRFKNIIVTSNYSPEQYFEYVPDQSKKACLRRITKVMSFS